MDTDIIIQLVINNQTAQDLLQFWMDENTRPLIDDDVPEGDNLDLFEIFEAIEFPVSWVVTSENTTVICFRGLDTDDLLNTCKALTFFGFEECFVFLMDDGEYKEYFIFENNKLISIYNVDYNGFSDFDSQLAETEWDERSLDLVVNNYRRMATNPDTH